MPISWYCNDNKLVFDTFEQAIRKNPEVRPLLHSDRGFQYTSKAFQIKLSKQGMEQSMSRVGHCIDNGPVEGFWGIVKAEMYSLNKFSNSDELRSAIDQYVYFYNYERFQNSSQSPRTNGFRNTKRNLRHNKMPQILC